MLWDEENRLEAVSDNGYVSLYTYDAGGERVAKLSGNGESVYVNSKNAGKRTQTNRYTAYISPYFVLSSGGEYTKHIMIGSQRIVSKLGDVGSFGQDPRRIEYAGTTESIKVDYKTKYKKSQQIFRDRYKRLDVVYNGKDNDDYRGGDSFCCGKQKDGFGKKGARPSKGAKGGITNSDKPELFQYYYHPDHLGSSSYITNLDGDIAQHIEYVPFGEVFINEQNNRWNTPYLFNAKELDEETGLYYYGARYYNPRTSQWLSVDPLAEETLDPYGYCHQNPINMIDPTGMKGEGLQDDYKLDKKGNITLVKKTGDNFDRILKTDKKGNVKKHGTGFLVSKSKKGKPKVAVDEISKGILKEGLNLQENDTMFEVNGENQPSLENFNKFISEFSDYVGKEIAGIRLGKIGSDKVSRVRTHKYKNSTRVESQTPKSWLTRYRKRLKGHFHTHPYHDHSPSEKDLNLKREYPKIKFYIISGGYEKKF